jgi:transcription elongation factor
MSVKDKIVKTKDGRRIAEHRYIMEQIIGRALKSNEVVHHINCSHDDNRKENLQLMTRAEHSRLHGKMPKNRTKKASNRLVKVVSIKDKDEKDLIEFLEKEKYFNNFSYYVKNLIREDMKANNFC